MKKLFPLTLPKQLGKRQGKTILAILAVSLVAGGAVAQAQARQSHWRFWQLIAPTPNISIAPTPILPITTKEHIMPNTDSTPPPTASPSPQDTNSSVSVHVSNGGTSNSSQSQSKSTNNSATVHMKNGKATVQSTGNIHVSNDPASGTTSITSDDGSVSAHIQTGGTGSADVHISNQSSSHTTYSSHTSTEIHTSH